MFSKKIDQIIKEAIQEVLRLRLHEQVQGLAPVIQRGMASVIDDVLVGIGYVTKRADPKAVYTGTQRIPGTVAGVFQGQVTKSIYRSSVGGGEIATKTMTAMRTRLANITGREIGVGFNAAKQSGVVPQGLNRLQSETAEGIYREASAFSISHLAKNPSATADEIVGAWVSHVDEMFYQAILNSVLIINGSTFVP